jgi:hypothetical protein
LTNELPASIFAQWLELQKRQAVALDNRDEDAVIQIKAQIKLFASQHGIDLTKPVTPSGTTPTHVVVNAA